MTPDAFSASLRDAAPPEALGPALAALWWDRQGDWQRAHELAQSDAGAPAALAHAYLHRKEGDLGNARYWYARAGRPVCAGGLEAEWASLVAEFTAS